MSSSVVDLVEGMTMLNIETVLKHAAKISLAGANKRSIGPDLPLWSERKSYNNNADKEAHVTTHSSPSSADCTLAQVTTRLIPTTVHNILVVDELKTTPHVDLQDIPALNNRILKREIEQHCKKTVRTKLCTFQKQREQSVGKHELRADQENIQVPQNLSNRLAIKQEIDAQIEQQAEKLAKADQEAQQTIVSKLQKQTELKVQELSYQGLARYQAKFRCRYESIVIVLLALDNESQKACGDLNRQLRELVQMFDQLINKIKAGSCGPAELKTAEHYCNSLNSIEASMNKEIKQFSLQAAQQQQIKIDEAKAKQLAEEQQRAAEVELEKQNQLQREQELEAQKQAAVASAAAAVEASAAAITNAPTEAVINAVSDSVSTLYVHPIRLAFYNNINQLYHNKVERVKPLQTDEAWKKYRTYCQRAINVPLNAISAVSAQHLTLNFEKLYNFFAGQPSKTTDGGTITINDHPLARDYCILLMAKKFVSQTETAISGNPQAAFPFASVIVSFWKLLPDFGKIFLAYIYKESPYLVPYFMPQQPGQTEEQHKKSLGYRMTDKNEFEVPNMYLKRQAGIARLYAAIIITPGRKGDGPAHPFGIEEAWRWLTHMLQLKPQPDICATMIMEMLQTLGFELWRSYGRQFVKLLLYLQQNYLPQLAAYDKSGPKMRLELLLARFLQERQIPQADGVLPPNFW